MNGTEKVVKHLEMIQGVIKRLGFNSFMVKGASIVFVITSQVLFCSFLFSPFYKVVFTPEEGAIGLIAAAAVLTFLIIGFWILDGFFLWLERLFRYHYDAIRKQDDTDFNMDVGIHKNGPFSSWGSAIFSVTLVIFYGVEIVFILFLPVIFLFGM